MTVEIKYSAKYDDMTVQNWVVGNDDDYMWLRERSGTIRLYEDYNDRKEPILVVKTNKGNPNLSEDEIFSLIDSFDDVDVVSRNRNIPDEIYDELDEDIVEFWDEINEQREYNNKP